MYENFEKKYRLPEYFWSVPIRVKNESEKVIKLFKSFKKIWRVIRKILKKLSPWYLFSFYFLNHTLRKI